ncbi:FtsK/SpoIIIE domain-containing protein [Nocardia sp. NPDC056000]|uniref:FtsK/SpoIIIE domain-containing protein n=1 Tax=Nocardia sp. NPDC056000 TaxID=3345674 RepID=UPI0035D9E002
MLFTVGVLLVGTLSALWAYRRAARGVPFTRMMAQAPDELVTAVTRLAGNGQRNRMLATLKLGSVEAGFPRLEWWDYTDFGLIAEFTVLGGQSTKTWTDAETLDAMAHYLGVPKVTVTSPGPSRICLEMRAFDVLATAAKVPQVVADDVDLEAVPTGIFEDGSTWCVPIQGSHVLLAGRTGSGKSGVLWSLINGMGPAIRSGRVDLRVIDPKAMELSFLEPLCTQFQCTEPEDMVALLEGTVRDMREATHRYRGKVRKPVPTPENPLTVVIIDEAATLSAFSDPELRRRFERAHGMLLSQGRAPLFSIIETVIDPSKDTVPQRQLFPYRIGLGMDESGQVDMIHGRGARERGSHCDEIPTTTQGVCYVQEDGKAGFRRARAFHVQDADVDRIVAEYAPLPRPINLADFGEDTAA